MIQLNLTPPGCFGVLPTRGDVEQCPQAEQTTQDGPGGDFKPCLTSHGQSYTKAAALSVSETPWKFHSGGK